MAMATENLKLAALYLYTDIMYRAIFCISNNNRGIVGMPIPNETWPCSCSANSFLGVRKRWMAHCKTGVALHSIWYNYTISSGSWLWTPFIALHGLRLKTHTLTKFVIALFEKILRKLNKAILPSYQLANKSASWFVNHCCKRWKCWSQDERRFASSWGEVLRFAASIKWHTTLEHLEGMVRKRQTVWYMKIYDTSYI